MIRIHITSVIVDDQAKAEKFYVEKMGFRKKHDFPAGGARWLTVENADGTGVELLLEPCGYDFAKAWQASLYENGIPITSFAVDDIKAEAKRLREAGVTVRGEPSEARDGMPSVVTIEDGCGNLLMLVEQP